MKKLFSTLLMGVFILTSVSVFTSCKDNDDDIKAIREDVAALRAELTNVKAALETELQSSKSQFETQIAQVKKELQDAIDKKADEATVSALREKLTGLETDYLAKVAVLETQIETANKALAKLDDKADKATVDNVIANLAALTGQLSDESKAREALEANLAIQIEALKKLRQELTDANYQGQIDGLIQACQNFETTVGDVSVMKKTINNLELQLSSFNQYISALTVFVERQLNSISLVPQLFVGGIEAIEFKTLRYQEFKKTNWYTLDNGETEATYRLNPTTVQIAGIDTAKIEFLAATAETRAISVPSPVKYNGIKGGKIENGLMTVYLKKADNFRNTRLGDGTDPNPSIYIVALKVPRNTTEGYEAADVISENSRLVENYYSPRIAADNPGTWHASWSDTQDYYDGVNNDKASVKVERPNHYWTHEDVWGPPSPMIIDDTPLKGVAQVVDYNKTFNVSTIVTGCMYEYTGVTFVGNCIRKMDVNELKKYGIEINYSIPTEVYNVGAPNGTNQQEFAEITDPYLGTIKAKTPANVSDNKAVIGKEPVVKIQMKDIINNKVIDERYLKIKWSDERVTRETKPVTFTREPQEFDPCGTTTVTALTWREVVNQVYAVLGQNGISEETFREVYWPDYSDNDWTVSWNCDWDPAWASLTNAPKQKSNVDPKPRGNDSPNLHGDAVVAEWIFEPGDIKTVYCSRQEDTKTFTAEQVLKSNDTRYPYDLKLTWVCTFKLPTLPAIVGHYNQYWLNDYTEYDILPLQYESDMQKWWRSLGSKTYCFYDNNLMNAFVYADATPVANARSIVKNLKECSSWDIQFAYNQSIGGHKAGYTPGDAADLDSQFDTGNGYRIYKSKGLEVETRYFSDPGRMINWTSFGAYQYWRGSLNQLLQMNWMSNEGDDFNPMTLTNHDVPWSHLAWQKSNNIRDRRTYLFADHYSSASDWTNDYMKPLLNKLDENPANDVPAAQGLKEPARIRENAIDINIWGALNAWNYIPVKSYKAYMIAPLRFNRINENAVWYDGTVDGSPVDWRKLCTLTDFRGYSVANTTGLPKQLWDYYEVQGFEIFTSQAEFGLKVNGGDVVIDPTNWMTAATLNNLTNGAANISFEYITGTNEIYFWNYSGSNVRINGDVKVRIPIRVKYGFGTLDSYLEGTIKPHI